MHERDRRRETKHLNRNKKRKKQEKQRGKTGQGPYSRGDILKRERGVACLEGTRYQALVLRNIKMA